MLTVAICTWNRADLLGRSLNALTAVVIPPGLDWEVVVIDNSSTDHTARILQQYRGRLPLRSVLEPAQGLSFARNRAVSEARGEAILWTDDDALVDPGWIAAYSRALTVNPDVTFFGGPISAHFDVPPPAWLIDAWQTVSGAYAMRDLGLEAIAFGPTRVPYGPNYAVRTDVHRRFEYDTELGNKGSGNIRGEEVALLRALLKAGHLGRWVPEARVKHIVPASRQTIRYLRHYYEGTGILEAKLLGPFEGPSLFGSPRWLWRHALTKEAVYRWCRLTQPARAWVPAMTDASITWGMLKGSEHR